MAAPNRTGESINSPSENDANYVCSYNSLENNNDGRGSCGGGGSTTGTIYGVYDMNSGSFEVVLGNFANSIRYSNFPLSPSNIKYVDQYRNSNNDGKPSSAQNTKLYGDAINETLGWYTSSTPYITFDAPDDVWTIRSGDGSYGIFTIGLRNGTSNTGSTSQKALYRPILIPKMEEWLDEK